MDELAGKLLAFGLRCGGDIEVFKGGIKQTEQRAELLGLAAVGCGRKHDEVLPLLGGNVFDERMALLLGSGGPLRAGAGMNFVHDHQLGTFIDEGGLAGVLLDVINRKDLKRVELIDGGVSLDFAIQTGLCIRADDHGLDADFITDFLLPLITKMRQADDRKAADFAAIQQLANDQQRLNSFTDTDVISHQQSDCFLTQRHDQGHHLVTPWPE